MGTETEVIKGYLIHNATEKYNIMVAEKELTKIDPKHTKIIALATSLSKLEKKPLYL